MVSSLSIAEYLQSPFELISQSGTSLKSLITEYDDLLKKSDVLAPCPALVQKFQLEQFKSLLENYNKQFKKECCYKTNFGFIEKYELDSFEHPQIYVRADLHGDLRSLVENLKVLQQESLLGENYDCAPGVHLVFLGDYCDRGFYGIEILEILMLLHQENPGQVHLIRGNHENVSINLPYGYTDQNLRTVLADLEAEKLLTEFYETMPLSVYFCVKDEHKEFIQFTHGLFEVSLDPSPLLDNPQSECFLLVPKIRTLSERVKNLSDLVHHPLHSSAKRIAEIFAQTKFTKIEEELTTYNWADISPKISHFSNLGSRGYMLNAEDIKAYLDVSSDRHKVKLIMRGHQHVFSELSYANEVITTTLTVGVDSSYYKANEFDKAYLLKLDKKIANWNKKSIIRIRESDQSIIHQEVSTLKSDHPIKKYGNTAVFYLNN